MEIGEPHVAYTERKQQVLEKIKDAIISPTFCGKLHYDPITVENGFEYFTKSFMRIWSPHVPKKIYKLCFHNASEEIVFIRKDDDHDGDHDDDDDDEDENRATYHVYEKSTNSILVNALVFIVQDLQFATMPESPAYVQWQTQHPFALSEIGNFGRYSSPENRSEQRKTLFLIHQELRHTDKTVPHFNFTFVVNNMNMNLSPVFEIFIENEDSSTSKYITVHFPFTSSRIVVVRQIVGAYVVDSEWIYIMDPSTESLHDRGFMYLYCLLKSFCDVNL